MNVLIANLKADPRAAELVADVEAASTGLKDQKESWDTRGHAVRVRRRRRPAPRPRQRRRLRLWHP